MSLASLCFILARRKEKTKIIGELGLFAALFFLAKVNLQRESQFSDFGQIFVICLFRFDGETKIKFRIVTIILSFLAEYLWFPTQTLLPIYMVIIAMILHSIKLDFEDSKVEEKPSQVF